MFNNQVCILNTTTKPTLLFSQHNQYFMQLSANMYPSWGSYIKY